MTRQGKGSRKKIREMSVGEDLKFFRVARNPPGNGKKGERDRRGPEVGRRSSHFFREVGREEEREREAEALPLREEKVQEEGGGERGRREHVVKPCPSAELGR